MRFSRPKTYLFLVVLFFSTHLRADLYQVLRPLILELRDSGYPIHYFSMASRRVTYLKFLDTSSQVYSARYVRRLEFSSMTYVDEIVLPHFLKDQTLNRIKPLAQLHGEDLSSIFHEMWHAYFYHHIKAPNGDFYKRFVERSKATFPELSEKDAIDAMEESYGVFIGAVVSHYTFRLKNSADLLRNPQCIQSVECWARQDYHGYYYNSWGSPVPVNTPLPEQEKIWIMNVLLEGNFGAYQ